MKKAASSTPEVITRFAPSPTGYIHIGNIRTAIYAYLIAKQAEGKFILRIEDTDRARYVEGATEMVEDALRWLGLDWNEGYDAALNFPPYADADHTTTTTSKHTDTNPTTADVTKHTPAHDLGSDGPYVQSERKEIYHEWARKLIKQGRAYADPTPQELIDQYRQDDNAKKIPYLYRNHRPEHTPDWHEGLPLRFKSDPKPYQWCDEVMGDISTGPEVCDDIILIKKDGLPTYNFAHIVDDATMHVTHVVRGVEYLSSMPNYLALYEALHLDRPKFLCLPNILAPGSNKKLGKRDGAKSAVEYRTDGILPEALLNYLACLGWNDGTEQEIYSKEELIKNFRIDHIQNSGAHFDETKILWMNGQWIRRLVTEQGIAEFYPRTLEYWPAVAATEPDEKKQAVLAIIYDRLKVLSDLRTMTEYFFVDPEINLPELTGNKFLKKLSESELITLLTTVISTLTDLSDWNEVTLQDTLNQLLVDTGKKPAELFSLIRISVSFAPFSPALHLTLNVLGREATLARLNAVRTALSQG